MSRQKTDGVFPDPNCSIRHVKGAGIVRHRMTLAALVICCQCATAGNLGDLFKNTLNKESKQLEDAARRAVAEEKRKEKASAKSKTKAQSATANAGLVTDSPHNHLFVILPDGRLWLGPYLSRERRTHGTQFLERVLGSKLPEDIYLIQTDRNSSEQFKGEANSRINLQHDLLLTAFGGPKLTVQQLVERNSYEYATHPNDQFKQADAVRAESPRFSQYLEQAKSLPLRVAWVRSYRLPPQYDAQKHGFSLTDAGNNAISPAASAVEPVTAELNFTPFIEFDEAFARHWMEIRNFQRTGNSTPELEVMAYIEGQLQPDAVERLAAKLSRITYYTVESTVVQGSKMGKQITQMTKVKVVDFPASAESATAQVASSSVPSGAAAANSRTATPIQGGGDPFDHLFAPLPNGKVWIGSIPRRGDFHDQLLERILGKSLSSEALQTATDYSKDKRLQHEQGVVANLRARLIGIVGGNAAFSPEQLAMEFSGAYGVARDGLARDEFARRDVLQQETGRFNRLVEKSRNELKDVAFTEQLGREEYDFNKKGFPLRGGSRNLLVGTESFKCDFVAVDESRAREMARLISTADSKTRPAMFVHYGEGRLVTPKQPGEPVIQLTRSEVYFVTAEGDPYAWRVTRMDRLSSKDFALAEDKAAPATTQPK